MEISKPSVFSIHRPDAVWKVTTGYVDLFFETVTADGSHSARHHILRAAEGQFIAGMPLSAKGMQIVAKPSPDACFEMMSMNAVRQDIERGEVAAIRVLEDWILQLAEAAGLGRKPEKQFPLAVDKPFPQVWESRAVIPSAGVVWLRLLTGKALFLGLPGVDAIAGPIPIPVTRAGWVKLSAKSKGELFTTAALADSDPGKKALDQFHEVILACFEQNLAGAGAEGRSRIVKRIASDFAQMKTSILQLASPLLSIPKELFTRDDSCLDPVYLACKSVAGHQDLKLRAHPDFFSGEKVPDPIGLIARASGLRFRRVALRGKWWSEDGGPIVAFRDTDKRPVALLPKSPGRYELFDPVDNCTHQVNETHAASLNPLGFVFYRPFPDKPLGVMDLVRFGVEGCASDVAKALWAGLAAGVLGLLVPFATGVIFDSYIPAADRQQLLQLAFVLAVAAFSGSLLNITRGFAILRLEGKIDASVQAAVWDRLLSLPVPFFRDYTSGDLAMRSLGIIQIRQALTGSVLGSVLSGIFSLCSLGLMYYYNWRLANLGVGLVIVAVAISSAFGALQVRSQREIFRLKGKSAGAVAQFIAGVSKLRVAGAESRAYCSWAREFSQQRKLAVEARRVSNRLTVFIAVFPILCQAALFYYYADILADPTILKDPPYTTGDFLAFLAAFTQFLTAALLSSSAIVSVLGIIPLYERAKPILESLPEVGEARATPGKLTGCIELSNIVFRYQPEAPLVLRGISLRIEPGQFVAFVGASGCGKSTLFRMLLGFEKPESGAVYFDNKDLSGLDPQAVRRQMGVVLQNSRLASGDIFSNIVGSSPLTINDAWQAAKMAGMEEDIKHLPMGMHTVVSEGGGTLSGGQRQRLLIARAIVNNPRILLFDEATSALDNHTQAIVSHSLESLQTTRIVIAHRLSTIMNADRIYVLDKGEIVQSGAYGELIEQEGLFQNLAKRQTA